MSLRTKTYICLFTLVLGTNSEITNKLPKRINVNIYNEVCTNESKTKTIVPSCDCANNAWFAIQSTTGGDLVVDASEPDDIKLQHFTGSETQLWKFERANGPGTFYIINKNNRGVLDVDNDRKPFRAVTAEKKNSSLNQQWVTNFNGRLRNIGMSMNLDVRKGKFEPDTMLILWNANGNKAQEFVLQQK